MTAAARDHLHLVPSESASAPEPIALSVRERPSAALYSLLLQLSPLGMWTGTKAELAQPLGCSARTIKRWSEELAFTGHLLIRQHNGQASTYVVLSDRDTRDITRDTTRDITRDIVSRVAPGTDSSSSSSSSPPTHDIPTDQRHDHSSDGEDGEPPADGPRIAERMARAGFDVDEVVAEELSRLSPDALDRALKAGAAYNAKKLAADGHRLPPSYLLRVAFTEGGLDGLELDLPPLTDDEDERAVPRSAPGEEFPPSRAPSNAGDQGRSRPQHDVTDDMWREMAGDALSAPFIGVIAFGGAE